jgi:hypothetical protein
LQHREAKPSDYQNHLRAPLTLFVEDERPNSPVQSTHTDQNSPQFAKHYCAAEGEALLGVPGAKWPSQGIAPRPEQTTTNQRSTTTNQRSTAVICSHQQVEL